MKRFSLATRLFVNKNLKLGNIFELNSKQIHYLSNVMRKKVEDDISVFNGVDGEYICKIVEINKKQIFCKCTKKIREQKIENKIWLIFAPLKKERLFFLIEKATELGVTDLQPVFTDFTQIKKINKLEIFLKQWSTTNLIIFCDETGSNPLNKFLLNSKINFPVGILVGPEGGFSENERKILNSLHNIHSVSLGGRILRSDTATISSLSIFQSITGDWYKKEIN